MPDLFYGRYGDVESKQLYVPGMRMIETGVFDTFKINGLAPAYKKRHVANFWWWTGKKHTIIAWHDELEREDKVFIPTLLDQRDALEYARTVFPEVIPSAITFRFFQDYHEALLYD